MNYSAYERFGIGLSFWLCAFSFWPYRRAPHSLKISFIFRYRRPRGLVVVVFSQIRIVLELEFIYGNQKFVYRTQNDVLIIYL